MFQFNKLVSCNYTFSAPTLFYALKIGRFIGFPLNSDFSLLAIDLEFREYVMYSLL